MDHRGPDTGALEPRAQLVEHPAQHEGQRLEPLDRPLERQRRLESLLDRRRHERALVLATGKPLQGQPTHTQPFEQLGRGQVRQIAESFDSPATHRGQQGEGGDGQCGASHPGATTLPCGGPLRLRQRLQYVER